MERCLKNLMLLYLLCALCPSVKSENRMLLRYQEGLNKYHSIEKVESMPSREERTSNQSGRIIVTAESNNIPDSMLVSIKSAVEFWEAKLCNQVPIYITIVYDDLGDDNLSMLTDVFYTEYDWGSKLIIPSALNSQLKGESGGKDSPDAYVTFNTAVKWNCSHGDGFCGDSMNVFSSMLRAVAIGLGFGTSVSYFSSDMLEFQEDPYRTLFDNMVFSSKGEWLKNYKSGSRDLMSYVESSDSKFVLKKDDEYKMYSPNPYEFGKSLVYLDNPSSLMHYDFPLGDKKFQIDSITLEILNTIGWTSLEESPTVEIYCENVDENGVGSAYENHTFKIKDNLNVEGVQWVFNLYDNNGDEIKIKEGFSKEFCIDKISNPETYYINTNGYIKGEIVLYGFIDGQPINVHYALSLGLRPIIRNITNLKIVNNPTYREALFNVEYVGADELTMSIETDYSSVIHSTIVEEPFIAHCHAKGMSLYYDVWIDIIVENKYGYTIETVELYAPYVNRALPDEKIEECIVVDVYSAMGKYVGSYKCCEDIGNTLPKGIYIFRYRDGDEIIETKKIQL